MLRNCGRFLLVSACCVLTLGSDVPAAPVKGPAPAAKPISVADLLQTHGKALQKIQALQDCALPRPTVDPAEVVKRVGKDPKKLCQWVREQIAFEPYSGFLKGAVGTLSSGRANAADRSLLLAALLDCAGVKAQLVQGTIASAELPAPAMPAGTPPIDEAAALAAIKACGIDVDELLKARTAAQMDKQKSLEELSQRVDRDLQTLAKALDDGKVPLPSAKGEPATEHWWVRAGKDDLDPTLAKPVAKEAKAYDLKDLPAEAFHTIAFREVLIGNEKPATVLDARLRTVELFGKSIMIANMPREAQKSLEDGKKKQPDEIAKALKANRSFRASITIDEKAVIGKAFDVNGQVLKDDPKNDREAVGGLGGGLGGLFGGGDEEKPKTKLDQCTLEVEILSPGEKAPLVIQRPLLRPGATPAQKVYDLGVIYEFLVLPEDVSEAFVAQRSIQTFERLGQWLKDCDKKDPLTDKGSLRIPRVNGELLGFGLARRNELRRLSVQNEKAVFVHSRPTLAATFERLIDGKPTRMVRGIDIFNNHMIALGPQPKNWSECLGLKLGVMDTALEHVALVRTGGACHNSSVLLDKALLADVTPVLLKDAANLPAGFSPAAKQQMAAAMKDAVLVAIPGKVGAWYRIDLTTGATLGYVENGGGQAAVEYNEDVALVWMVYEYMQIYVRAMQCAGLALSLPLSMDPDGQREELGSCTCEVTMMVATSVTCILREADPVSLLDFGKFFAVAKVWDGYIEKLCEKAFKSEGEGHGEGGGE